MPGLAGPELPTVWRPRLGRAVPYALAVVVVVGFVVVAELLTSEGRGGARWIDRALLIGFGLAAAWVLHRLASVRIEADVEGLTVVNIFRRRRLEWAEVLGVRLSSGDPWVALDLADGTTMAAMGIQGADGARGLADARALAAAVAARSA